MKRFSIKLLMIFSLSITGFFELHAQGDLSNADYNKAVWMTTRFYGGQRSGGDNVNWLIYNHLPDGVNANLRGKSFPSDRDGNIDLSGGWHDCGDHVKFGQTQFYSAYTLLKGYAEFPEGHDDYYSFNYDGYTGSGDYTWEGGQGQPNGIPDILDELRHETDFLIKCSPNSSTFYYQVGIGGGSGDHATNNTSVRIQTFNTNQGGNNEDGSNNPSGPFRPTFGNPNDGAMPSFAAATLALMSRMYEPFDPAYASLCLTHAQNAYDYASNHIGQAIGTSGFYPANNNALNSWAIANAEMHWATTSSNNSSFRTTALALSAGNSNEQVRHFHCYQINNLNN